MRSIALSALCGEGDFGIGDGVGGQWAGTPQSPTATAPLLGETFLVPLKGGMGGGQRAEGLMQQREPLRFGKGRTTSPYRGGLGGRIV